MAGTRAWMLALLWLLRTPLWAQQVYAWKYDRQGDSIVLADSIIWVSSFHPEGQNLDARLVDSSRVILISDVLHRGELDIYLVDFLKGELHMITATKDDERLPWMDATHPYIFAVREVGERSYLWYYPKSGTSMGNVLYEEEGGSIANYIPVGESELFIMRRTNVHSLNTFDASSTSLILYDAEDKKKRRILRNISPSLAWMDSALYFIHYKTDEIVQLRSYRLEERHPSVLTSLPRHCNHLTALDSAAFLLADTSQLYIVLRDTGSSEWKIITGPKFSEMGWKRLLYLDAGYGWVVLTVEKAP